jgi:hypothetical protein
MILGAAICLGRRRSEVRILSPRFINNVQMQYEVRSPAVGQEVGSSNFLTPIAVADCSGFIYCPNRSSALSG